MRPVTDWDITDLNALIKNGISESLSLDYKASETLKRTDGGKKELAKDVSSFANSAGGMIVIGMVEVDNVSDHLDGGVLDSDWTREAIEQVITTNITPRIEGLTTRTIKAGPKSSYYVIEIPQATTNAPHQVMRDRRYYKRLHFTTDEMQDYEIRDAMRRTRSPNLYLDVQVTREDRDQVSGEVTLTLMPFTRNLSQEPAPNAFLMVAFGIAANRISASADWRISDPISFDTTTGHRVLPAFTKVVGSANHIPLYKEENIGHGSVTLRLPGIRETVEFITVITAPGCSRHGHGALSWKSGHYDITPMNFAPE